MFVLPALQLGLWVPHAAAAVRARPRLLPARNLPPAPSTRHLRPPLSSPAPLPQVLAEFAPIANALSAPTAPLPPTAPCYLPPPRQVLAEFALIANTSALTFMVAGTFKEIVTGGQQRVLSVVGCT